VVNFVEKCLVILLMVATRSVVWRREVRLDQVRICGLAHAVGVKGLYQRQRQPVEPLAPAADGMARERAANVNEQKPMRVGPSTRHARQEVAGVIELDLVRG
jgi:hypothetical protein